MKKRNTHAAWTRTTHGQRAPGRRRPVVLVVDDLLEVREIIRVVLETHAGVRVLKARTSREALKLAKRREFNLVTSDIGRPREDGLKFLRVFKKAHPQVPVIIVSGILDRGANQLRAERLGAFACLSKPFACAALLKIVGEALEVGRKAG